MSFVVEPRLRLSYESQSVLLMIKGCCFLMRDLSEDIGAQHPLHDKIETLALFLEASMEKAKALDKTCDEVEQEA